MKYKIKFQITYGNLEKDEIREHKLGLLDQDITTEIESEYPLSVPPKDEMIELGEELYSINSIYHKLEKDCYTSFISVTSNRVKKILEDKIHKLSDSQLRQMLLFSMK